MKGCCGAGKEENLYEKIEFRDFRGRDVWVGVMLAALLKGKNRKLWKENS